MAAKCEVEHDWRRCWRGSCASMQGCAELLKCAPFKRPPDPQGHPLDGLHINQGSLDAAADAYEAEYNKAHGIEALNAVGANRIAELEAGIRACVAVLMDSVVTHGTQGGWLHDEAKRLEALLTPNVELTGSGQVHRPESSEQSERG